MRFSFHFEVGAMLFVWICILYITSPVKGQSFREDPGSAPIPSLDEPVLAGYDLVAYHSLRPFQNGVRGFERFSYRHSNGYLYYFQNKENRDKFVANPIKYLPKYGGFCAWGMAYEFSSKGWPWAAQHMGPPCGPSDGWAIINGELYCSIWRSYQTDFNQKQLDAIPVADQRWIDYYGSLDSGPQNNGCYAWNWQECYARSIHIPNQNTTRTTNPLTGKDQAADRQTDSDEEASGNAVVVDIETEIQDLFYLLNSSGMANFADSDGSSDASNSANASVDFEEGQTLAVNWSDHQQVLEGEAYISWRWKLDKIETTKPSLIIELVGKNIESNQYMGFGVAKQLMEGPLFVCYEDMSSSSSSSTTIDESGELSSEYVHSTCITLIGAGMGTTIALEDDQDYNGLNTVVLQSTRNGTHYSVRFSVSLFYLLKITNKGMRRSRNAPNNSKSTPLLPSRVLFAKGLVSGNGFPLPHKNDNQNRQAITGVNFLSVIDNHDTSVSSGTTATAADSNANTIEDAIMSNGSDYEEQRKLILSKLSSSSLIREEFNTILDGRVQIDWQLYSSSNTNENNQKIIQVQLQLEKAFIRAVQEEYDQDAYIGFGFAEKTMTGLIVTCFSTSVDRNTLIQPTSKSYSSLSTFNEASGDLAAPLCKQWHGVGTNLYPRDLATRGGWFLKSYTKDNNGGLDDEFVRYTLVGYVDDVIAEKHLSSAINLAAKDNISLRAICAIGRATTDTQNPLMHHAGDRDTFYFDKLPQIIVPPDIAASLNNKGSTISSNSLQDNASSATSKMTTLKYVCFSTGVVIVTILSILI